MEIKISNEFSDRLEIRDEAKDFRERFLSNLDWDDKSKVILDFDGVKKISPSFANEAFAYFMQFTDPKGFHTKIKIKNATKIQNMIIDFELETGYAR